MFKNFFKVAIRIIARNNIYALINVLGLAIGISASIIIFLYVNREISYDRFHEKADCIYRVGIRGVISENRYNHAITPFPLSETLLSEVDGIEDVVRVAHFGAWLVRYEDIRYNEDNIVFADPSFFNIFSFPLIQGDPEAALNKPATVVISRSTAQKYFGNDNPLGKILRIENDTTYYEVTGVMEDIPINSHMHFDMVASLLTFPDLKKESSWVMSFLYTYFLKDEKVTEQYLSGELNHIVQQYVIPERIKMLNMDEADLMSSEFSYEFFLQPLRQIHLRSSLDMEFERNGNVLNVYLFSALAVVILIISCLNFVNIMTARTSHRAKEVSIRKIAGSDQKILVRQFLTESSIMAIFAMVLALLITELMLPLINQYIGINLILSQLINASGVLLVVVLILIVGILSGLYPAFYLSSYNPVKVMRSWFGQQRGSIFLRRLLVYFQFFLAVGMITMTIIIFMQYHFMVHKDLGINKENVVIVRRPDGLKDQLERYKKNILNHNHVISVTNSTYIPGVDGLPRMPFRMEGQEATNNFSLDYVYVSPSFAETFGVQMTQGRFFDADSVARDSTACVLNEAAIRLMNLSDPIGENILALHGGSKKYRYEVIGVFHDIHFEPLSNQIRPMILIIMPGNYEGYLSVKMDPENREETIRFLQEEWDKITTAYPFVSYDLEASLENNYMSIKEGGRIFLIVSITALLTACLALFSLVSYEDCRRRYEIGIHKVLGADIQYLLFVQFKDLLSLVVVSSLLAWVGVFFLARSWLNEIYYHIEINPLYFILASVFVLVVSIITSGYQAYLVAATNPAYTLKYE